MARYDVVLFDLDDTLRFSRPSHREVFARTLAQQGFPQPEARLKALWRWSHAFWANQPEVERLRAAHKDDPEGLWRTWTRMQLRFLGLPPEALDPVAEVLHQALQAWRANYQDWVPPDHLRLLETLKAQGLRLGLVTNRGEPLEEGYLERLGLAPYFDTVVVAAEEGVWKPDPRLFHKALERLGQPQGRGLYVGDNFFADYQGARAAGLDALLFDPMDLFPDLPVPRIRRLDEVQRWLDGRTPPA